MDLSFINPYIRIAMHSVIPPRHNIARRVIYDYELIYLERGNFTLVYNNVPYHCTAGDILFIRPGIPHCFQLGNSEISQPHIHFDITHRLESDKIPVSFKDLDAMTETELRWIHKDYFPSSNPTPLLRITNTADFLRLFYEILSRNTDPLTKKSLMLQILSVIIKENFPGVFETQASSSIVEQIKNYIDAGNGFYMSLTDFSKVFHYNRFYLEKKFKEAYHIGIIEYRNRKRMGRAKQLLETHSVSQVALQMGYGSIYSFSRAYKLHFGYAPSQSRQPISKQTEPNV